MARKIVAWIKSWFKSPDTSGAFLSNNPGNGPPPTPPTSGR